jgi:hypothetical protein
MSNMMKMEDKKIIDSHYDDMKKYEKNALERLSREGITNFYPYITMIMEEYNETNKLFDREYQRILNLFHIRVNHHGKNLIVDEIKSNLFIPAFESIAYSPDFECVYIISDSVDKKYCWKDRKEVLEKIPYFVGIEQITDVRSGKEKYMIKFIVPDEKLYEYCLIILTYHNNSRKKLNELMNKRTRES